MEYRERRRQQGQQTEKLILASAIELMKEQGFDQVSVRDICAHAGITTGAFYHHFRSKDELLERGFAPLDQYMEQQLSCHEDDTPSQRMDHILETYVTFMSSIGPTLIARYYQQRLTKPTFRSMDPTRFTLRAILNCFQEAKRRGELAMECAPEWAAQFCFSHFRGTLIDWVLSGHQEPLADRMWSEQPILKRLFLKQAQPV